MFLINNSMHGKHEDMWLSKPQRSVKHVTEVARWNDRGSKLVGLGYVIPSLISSSPRDVAPTCCRSTKLLQLHNVFSGSSQSDICYLTMNLN
jgi:hypothetical protein